MSKVVAGKPPVNRYTNIPNSLIRNKSVSDGAFRLICWVASHKEGFEISFGSIKSMLGYGRDKLRKILKEAEEANHLVRRRVNSENGLFDWEYHIFLDPSDAIAYLESIGGKPVDGDDDHRGQIRNMVEPPTDKPYYGSAPPHNKEQLEEEQLEKNQWEKSLPTPQKEISGLETCFFEEPTEVLSPSDAEINQTLHCESNSLVKAIIPPPQVETVLTSTYDSKLEDLVSRLDRGELKDLPIGEKKQLANYLMGEYVRLYRCSGWILGARVNDIKTDFLKYVAWKELKQPNDLEWARNTVAAYERDMTKWGQLVALAQGWQSVTPEEIAAIASQRVAARHGSKEDLQIAIQSSIDGYKTVGNNPFRRRQHDK